MTVLEDVLSAIDEAVENLTRARASAVTVVSLTTDAVGRMAALGVKEEAARIGQIKETFAGAVEGIAALDGQVEVARQITLALLAPP